MSSAFPAPTLTELEPLNSRQKRELNAAREASNPGTQVLAYAPGRANYRWTLFATLWVVFFVAVFITTLALLGAVLVPGVFAIYVLYDNVKPRRGVALTPNGITEFRLKWSNARATGELTTTDHGALFEPRGRWENGKFEIAFPDEAVSLKERDLYRLRSTLARQITAPAAAGMPVLPPPPSPAGPKLPRWRQGTFLWVTAHVLLGFVWMIALLFATDGVLILFGRENNQTSKSADIYLWYIVLVPVAAWLLFVYLRTTFRIRALVLGSLLASVLLLASIVFYVYSPPPGH